MVDEKNWYESKTIWGALLAIAASLAGMLGISIDTASQNDIATAMVELIGTVGALVAIYGRLSATDVIS